MDYYIPETTVGIDEFFALMESQGQIVYSNAVLGSREKFICELKSKIECKNIPIETNKDTLGMLEVLLMRYFDHHKPNDIDLLIFTGPFRPLADKFSTPHKLIEKFDLEGAMIFEVGNRCCSISSAIQVAKAFLECNTKCHRAMILSQNHIRGMLDRFHQGNSIEGDGASVLVLEPSDTNVLQDYLFMNCGKFHAYLFDNALDGIASQYLGYVASSATIIDKLMKKLGISSSEIVGIIIQNINTVIARMISKKIGVDSSIIYTNNIHRYGHIADVDFVINLKDFLDGHHGGGNVICQNTGAGLTADATLIERAWRTQ
jgi:3-oxoacyl-[acyl-carrier-protein] synthase III